MFVDKCIRGIDADRKRCEEMVEKLLAMVTALAPGIGYDGAAEETGDTVQAVARRRAGLSSEQIKALFDPIGQTGK